MMARPFRPPSRQQSCLGTMQNLKLTQGVILSEAKDLRDPSVASLPQDDVLKDVSLEFRV